MQNQESQFRPCIVTERYIRARNVNGEFSEESERQFKALFHFWHECHKYYNNCGYGAYAQPSHTTELTAIVEYEDGSVHAVPPEYIRFVDKKVNNSDFQTACRVIRDELLNHEDFYKAFVASVQSAIREAPSGTWPNELSERIVKRIIGEE